MIKSLKTLFYIFIPIFTLVVWNGNATSIEIKLPVIQLFSSVFLIGLAVHHLKKDELKICYNRLIVVFLLFVLVALYKYFSTTQFSFNYRVAMAQIYGAMAFLIVLALFEKKDLKKIIEIIVYTSIPASIYGIIQFFKLDPVDWVVINDRLRVISVFGHKNYFALYLLLVIPLNIYLLLVAEKNSKKVIFIIAFVLSITALMLSYSRGALASFLLLGTGAYFLYLKRIGSRQFKINKLLYFIPVVVILVLPFVIPQKIKDDISNLYKKRELNTRISFWKAGMEISFRKGMAGIGPGNFKNEYPLNQKNRIYSHSPNLVVDHVHNDFIEIFLEYGLIQLLLYVSLIFIILNRFLKGFFDCERSKDEYLLLLAVSCSIISFIAYSTVTVGARYVSSLFYLWMIIAFGELVLDKSEKSYQLKFNNKVTKIITFSIFIILIVFSAYKSVNRYYASHLVHKSQDHMKRKIGNATEALNLLDKAISIDRKNIEAIYAKGYASFMIGDIENAENYYLRIFKIFPAYVNIAFNLASCYYKQNNWIEALFYAKESFKQFPGYSPNAVMLGYCYYYLQEPEKAQYYCNLILRREPQNQGALALKQRLMAIGKGGSL